MKINKKEELDRKIWSAVGIFIIALVVSLPIYSAGAMAASLQITQNQGEKGISKFLDAQGDVWKVQASITGALEESINPENVKLKIGNREAAFSSCSSVGQVIVCDYISPLTDGIPEGEYVFRAAYSFINENAEEDEASASDVVKADGQSPAVEGLRASQNIAASQDIANSGISIDFSVNDKVNPEAPAVGLKLIEIIDAESGNVLQSITGFSDGLASFRYAESSEFGGRLQSNPYAGSEGYKQIKIRAEDRLGHSFTSSAISFPIDFVKPVIVADSLNFTQFGKFIGPYRKTSEMTVEVRENGGLNARNVKAYSAQAELTGREADSCAADRETAGLYKCTWNSVEVSPESSVSVRFEVKDDYGNVGEGTLARSFVPDTEMPAVEFFGTERQFNGVDYVRSDEQLVMVRVSENGAGITAEGIRADLSALGGSEYTPPAQCEETDRGLDCYWKTTKRFQSSGTIVIGLSKLEDNVGNAGQLPEIELSVDVNPPKVEKIELFGGEKNYFQSNDQVMIEFTAAEGSGLLVLVNLNDAVMDAETTYPKGYFGIEMPPEDGWKVYTDEDASASCEQKEGKWKCKLQTDALKSGPDSSMELDVLLMDTGGNPAVDWQKEPKNVKVGSKGHYIIELLGLSAETEPDYWEVSSGYPTGLLKFVDLDTVGLTLARMPLLVQLRSDNSQAEALSVSMIGCEPEEGSPTLSGRNLIYGGNFPEGEKSPKVTMVLEFAPFDGRAHFGLGEGEFKEVKAKYKCQLRVYSKLGNNALGYPELQEVEVSVPFSFSELGAIDENIKDRIKDIRESGFMKFLDAISYIDSTVKWINYIANVLSMLQSASKLMDLTSDVLKGAAEMSEDTGVATGWGAALRGTCLVPAAGQEVGWKFIDKIQGIVQVLNCNPSAITETAGAIGWYGKWQRTVLDLYNTASLRGVLGVPATSLYDNLYTSSAGLCVSGIAFNLNKWREIKCRQIICYATEVPAGIATIDGCNKLYDLQTCEFFYGPLFDFVGLGGIAAIGKMLQGFLSSRLGLIKVAEVIGCSFL